MIDFQKIKREYISTNLTYRELAQKYGISHSFLQKVGAREKWGEARKKANDRKIEKVVEMSAEKEARRVDGIQNVADALLEKIKQGVEEGIFTSDTQSIRQVVSSLKDLMEIKGYKHDLDIQEQMARIDKLRKECGDTEEKEIHVVIDSKLDEYGG